MRKDKPSKTTYKAALSVFILGVKPKMDAILGCQYKVGQYEKSDFRQIFDRVLSSIAAHII